MFIPVVIGFVVLGTTGYAVRRSRRPKGMTAERRQVYDFAMSEVMDPVKILEMADAFQKEGLREEAKLLRKRAELRSLPADIKKKRRKLVKELLKSTDKQKVLAMADVFDGELCTGVADQLRQYAAGLPDTSRTGN